MNKLLLFERLARTYIRNYNSFLVTSRFTRRIFLCLALFCLVLAIPVSALAATLSLSPSSGTFNRGCSFTLAINLDTASSQTDGTDAILNFDPTRITASNITAGTIYSDYPGTNIDATGKITISGLASVAQPFTGSGVLASIAFSVPANAPTGAAQVTFDFDPANPTKTTDSNVVERNTVKDVLTSVTNGSYTIGTGACSTQTQTGTSGGTSTSGGTTGGGSTVTGGGSTYTTPGGVIPVKTLPPAGSEILTYTLGIIGITLTFLGILGMAIL